MTIFAKITKIFFLPFAAIIFSSAISAQDVSLSTQEEARYQQEVLAAVNKYRIKHGLQKLKLVEAISKEAIKHSEQMASRSIEFSHKDFDKRVQNIRSQIPNVWGSAENIAYFKLQPAEVVAKWLTSQGHKKNIEGRYTLTGIGVAKDAKGFLYYTQIFVNG